MSGSGQQATALITLPLAYNPDRKGWRKPVEDDKFERTAEDVARRFGGGTLKRSETSPPQGFWWDAGVLFKDELAVLEVVFEDTPRNRSWIVSYAKRVLCSRFRQEAIYVRFVGPVTALTITRKRIGR